MLVDIFIYINNENKSEIRIYAGASFNDDSACFSKVKQRYMLEFMHSKMIQQFLPESDNFKY